MFFTRPRWTLAAPSLAFVGLGACALDAPDSAPSNLDPAYAGTGIAMTVGALDYPGAADACYSFSIANEADELVVGRGPSHVDAGRHPGGVLGFSTPAGYSLTPTDWPALCSTSFGNGAGGDISYVAPCDGSAGNTAHTVTLWLDFLELDDGSFAVAGDDYQDPCPSGCAVTAICVENADVPVTFNFTVMRAAEQGFFDVAVNFDDIFCSAKLDTCYGAAPGDTPITLVHGLDGERGPTAVLALACTAGGEAGVETWLHAAHPVIDCDGVQTTLPLGAITVEGNQGTIDGLSWAAWFGTEALESGGASLNKHYLNLGITGFGDDCTVSWAATATDGPVLSTAYTGATGATFLNYPSIEFGPVAVTDGNGAWLCTQNPLNGTGSTVVTQYAAGATPEALVGLFCTSWAAGAPAGPCDGPCGECTATQVKVIAELDNEIDMTTALFQSDTATLQEEIDVTQVLIAQLDEDRNELQRLMKDLEALVESLQQDRAQLEAERAELEAQLDALDPGSPTYAEERDALMAQIEINQTQLVAVVDDMNVREDQLAETAAELNEVQAMREESLADLESLVVELNDLTETYNTEIQNLEKQRAEALLLCEEPCSPPASDPDPCGECTATQVKVIAELDNEIDMTTALFQSDTATLQEEIDVTQVLIAQLDEDRNELQRLMKDLEALVESLQQDRAQLEAERAELEAQLDALDPGSPTYAEERDALMAQIEINQTQLVAVVDDMNVREDQLAETAAELNEVQAMREESLADLESLVVELNDLTETYNTEIQNLEKQRAEALLLCEEPCSPPASDPDGTAATANFLSPTAIDAVGVSDSV